eukprot:m.300041 g.300041  ORF g.300041 m.300041 type:complete len:69 (+) comp16418_c2_seq25:240-446(+)
MSSWKNRNPLATLAAEEINDSNEVVRETDLWKTPPCICQLRTKEMEGFIGANKTRGNVIKPQGPPDVG